MADALYLRAPQEKRRPPPGIAAVLHLDEPGRDGYPLHHNLARLPAVSGLPGQTVAAFLLAALGVWAADKFLPRTAAPDAWTRQVTLHLPVSADWLPMAGRLSRLLNFLTGDDWTLKLRPASLDLGLKGVWPHAWRPDGVMLFSGGLDSLVGAVDYLEAGERLLLVSHYDFGQLASIQQGLAAALLRHYGPQRVHHLGLRVQFPQAPELSMRSRSLLYLALGLTAAASFGPATPLIIPENGWISLNPPLTWNRLGSCSTRTTHPYFLEQLTGLWRDAGLVNPLVNPYDHLTKGEMVRRSRNRDLLGQLFGASLSCARPVVSRWQGRAAMACGYCYPCLMRRAALHSLGWDRGEDYGRDVLSDPEALNHRVRGRDLRALLLAAKSWEETPAAVEARLMLGSTPEAVAARLAAARRVLDRGFHEIAGWLKDQGSEWVGRYSA
jgi:7-cyano-7-deazaguanine synthase in queuosine biosynthesis